MRLETREHLQRAMEIYRPKHYVLAWGFITRPLSTPILIVATLSNPIFSEPTRGIQGWAEEKGHQVIPRNMDPECEEDAGLVGAPRERQIKAPVMTTTDLEGRILAASVQIM